MPLTAQTRIPANTPSPRSKTRYPFFMRPPFLKQAVHAAGLARKRAKASGHSEAMPFKGHKVIVSLAPAARKQYSGHEGSRPPGAPVRRRGRKIDVFTHSNWQHAAGTTKRCFSQFPPKCWWRKPVVFLCPSGPCFLAPGPCFLAPQAPVFFRPRSFLFMRGRLQWLCHWRGRREPRQLRLFKGRAF